MSKQFDDWFEQEKRKAQQKSDPFLKVKAKSKKESSDSFDEWFQDEKKKTQQKLYQNSSMFDEERKRLGISTNNSKGVFDEDRKRIAQGKPTLYEEKRMAETAQPQPYKKGVTKLLPEISLPAPYKRGETKVVPQNPLPEPYKKGTTKVVSGKDSNWFIDSQKFVDDKVFKPVENLVGRAISKMSDELTFGQYEKQSPKDAPKFLKEWSSPAENKAEKAADIVGTIAGMAAPIGGAYKATSPLAKGIYKGVTKGSDLGKLAKYADDAIKGATAALAYGATREGIDEGLNPEDSTLKERAQRVGMETALGFFGDPLTRAVGAGLKKGVQSKPIQDTLSKIRSVFGKQTPQTPGILGLTAPQNKTLALPEPQKALPEPLSSKVKNNPLFNFGQSSKSMPKARMWNRDASDYVNPKWEQRLNEFADYVNSNYDTNKLTKEALDDAWSRFANYDESITLEKLVDLGTPSLNRYKAMTEPKNVLVTDANPSQALKATKPYSEISKGLTDMLNVNKAPAKAGILDGLKVNQSVSKVPNLDNILPPSDISLRGSKLSSNELKERGFINTLRNSEKPTEAFKTQLKGTYEPITNKETVNLANQRINKDIEEAVSFVKDAKKLTAEHVATAHRLIDEFQKSGNIDRAVDIAEYIAEQGTKAGQSIQAFSIYNRLTPEGMLVHASRIAKRTNQTLNVLDKPVKVTKEIADQITDLSAAVGKMTNTKGMSNDVINLMEKAKAGAKLTDDELKAVRQFVTDAKQFIDDVAPKSAKPRKPKPIQNKVVKQKVIMFLDEQEKVARERIAARKNRINSLPLDEFYDYAVIGASKLARGTVNLADFTKSMVDEFGEEVRPYAQQIYNKAVELVDKQSYRATVQRLTEVEKIVNSALKNAKVDAGQADIIKQMAKEVGKMSDDFKLEASQNLQATLQLLERPTWGDKISTTQTIAQLLNPKTLVRNAFGNEMFYRLERMNKMIATPIDWARVKVFGGQRVVTFRTNNQGQYWKSFVQGAKAGWKGVNPAGLQTKYDIKPNAFSNKWNPLTYLQKALGVTLQSFDYAGYKRAVNDTIGELATLRAMNEGLTGTARKQVIERYIREADENILEIADEYGKYITFQDNNVLSVGLQKFKRGLNFGKDFGFGDLIIKYPKTPGALLMRAMEYSPAGFLRSAYILSRPFYKEALNGRELTLSLSRAITGTLGLTGLGYYLADKGILTGSGDKDRDINQLEQMVGKGEYSVNVDALTRWVLSGFNQDKAELREGDEFITYNWAQPVAVAFSIGANVNQSVNEKADNTWEQTAFKAGAGALDTMVETSVLSGVKNAFQTYPNQSVAEMGANVLGDLPSSFVPTLLNQVKQLTDNTYRNTYDPSKTQTYMNRGINKVPGAASILPPAFDTLGRPKEIYQDNSNNLFNVLLNPSFVSKYKPTPTAKMVLDVLEATGEKKVAPRTPQKSITVDGKRIDLTPLQYSKLQKRVGEETQRRLEDLLPKVNTTSNEKMVDLIYDALNNAGKAARDELKKEISNK